MDLHLNTLFVNNQDNALLFYTEMLGFVMKSDTQADDPPGVRWLTVAAPDDPTGVELFLELSRTPAAKALQRRLFMEGIPSAVFIVEDVWKAYDEMRDRGVIFYTQPVRSEWGTDVVCDDGCGNLIELHQHPVRPARAPESRPAPQASV